MRRVSGPREERVVRRRQLRTGGWCEASVARASRSGHGCAGPKLVAARARADRRNADRGRSRSRDRQRRQRRAWRHDHLDGRAQPPLGLAATPRLQLLRSRTGHRRASAPRGRRLRQYPRRAQSRHRTAPTLPQTRNRQHGAHGHTVRTQGPNRLIRLTRRQRKDLPSPSHALPRHKRRPPVMSMPDSRTSASRQGSAESRSPATETEQTRALPDMRRERSRRLVRRQPRESSRCRGLLPRSQRETAVDGRQRSVGAVPASARSALVRPAGFALLGVAWVYESPFAAALERCCAGAYDSGRDVHAACAARGRCRVDAGG